jgi:hypothetical protein
MILNEKVSDGIVSNIPVANRGQFTIAANGKAFTVLSDTLYQDKIGSIVRELSCNAYDSHKEAGKEDIPFVIHLPTTVEPYFSVKDFGIGMDAETVSNVFTSLFVSTKEGSNNSVGAFGLGSKTPFAYTDSFTVIAVKNGISRTFSMYKDEDGLPMHAMLGQKETDESNGVEIIIPINNISDRRAFSNAIVNQLHFLPTRPVITGSEYPVEWYSEPTEILVEYGRIKVFVHKYGQDRVKYDACAVMGPVGYQINFNILAEKIPNHSKVIQWLANRKCRIYFNIGDISVTPSRENLSYDTRTLKAFNDAFNGFLDHIVKSYNDNMQGLKSPLERAKFLSETNDDLSNVITISQKNADNGIWGYNGRHAYFDNVTVRNYLGTCVTFTNFSIQLIGKLVKQSRYFYDSGRYTISDLLRNNLIDVPIIFMDECKFSKRRLVRVSNELGQNTFVVQCDTDKIDLVREAFKFSGFNTKLLSEFDAIEVEKLDSNYVKANGYVLDLDDISRLKVDDMCKTRYNWKKLSNVKEIEASFYIESEGGIVEKDSLHALENLKKLMVVGLVDMTTIPTVYCFPKRLIDKIKKDPEWTNLSEYLTANYDEKTILDMYKDNLVTYYMNSVASNLEFIITGHAHGLFAKSNKDFVDKFNAEFLEYTTSNIDSKNVESVIAVISKSAQEIRNIIYKYVENIKKVLPEYPLFKYLYFGHYARMDDVKDDLISYMQSADKKNGFDVNNIDFAVEQLKQSILTALE